MKTLPRLCALALLSCTGFAAGANATVIYSNTTATPDTATDNSYTYTFGSSSATSAIAKIELQGYASLDGNNFYEDDFTLIVNGTDIYKATFDLGGGGSNVVYMAPAGSTFTVTPMSTGAPTFAGGVADLTIPVSILNGSNTFTLSYDSLPAPDHAGFQGIGDEGFGVNSVVVSSVPLSASAPMFGAALVAMGIVGYSLKRKSAATAA